MQNAGAIVVVVLVFALLVTIVGLGAATVAKLNGGAGAAGGTVSNLSHGCKASTGYVWCPTLNKCVRPWETPCPPSGGADGGSSEAPSLAAVAGGPTTISAQPSGPALHPNLTATEAQGWINNTSGTSTLVVWRSGCPHCDSLKSKLAALATSGSLSGRRVGLITASEAQKLGTKLDVHHVPALLRVGSGQIQAKHEGDMPIANILGFV